MNLAARVRPDESEIQFDEGVIGVPGARRFHLMEQAGSPIRLLHCLDIAEFALPVVDPFAVDPEYKPALGRRVSRALRFESDDAVLMLAVVTRDQGAHYANLRAPLIINANSRLGIQVILDGAVYSVRTPFTPNT